MSGLTNYTYATLKQAILDYTEVDANVFTTTILDGFIMAAQHRINLDLPMDSDREEYFGSLATDVNTVRVPAGILFVRGVQVFNSTTSRTGQPFWLERRDQTFISEFVGKLTGTAGGAAAQDVTGLPKYYAMFGGATGLTDTTSGSIVMAPTPDANYLVNIYGNAMPVGLGSGSEGNSTTYISNYFPQGLLYACLAEAYGFLKGPTDMLTLYDGKYKQELQKFAAMQIGRRRRDDYTDGTIRIPIESPSQ
tara:strand:- start:1995 stop:2744 length:750 start_codon:yes stop_codon:yes gene_type:complete